MADNQQELSNHVRYGRFGHDYDLFPAMDATFWSKHHETSALSIVLVVDECKFFGVLNKKK